MLVREQTALIVIDIQDKLLPQSDAVHSFFRNAIKLIQCADGLDIPILITEQNPERLGGTNAEVTAVLGTRPRIGKMEFSCLANRAFEAVLGEVKRRKFLLIGMETHICVMQTALDLLAAGFDAFVAQDACLSMRNEEHEAGLRRMEREGVCVVTAQMAIFEWLRAAGTPEFKRLLPFLRE